MPDLDASEHEEYNNTIVLAESESLTNVRFWDVGTGNCNTLMNGVKELVYYDFGGNAPAGGGSKTYPGTLPAFDFTNEPVFVSSHWDEDHFYSLKKFTNAGSRRWIGTRDDISNRGRTLLVKHCKKNVKMLRRGTHDRLHFDTHHGARVSLLRCTATVGGDAEKRNNNGIVLFVHVNTPARTLVEEMKRLAAANPLNPGLVAAAGAIGTDIYVNLVKQSALYAASNMGATGASVCDAATHALGAWIVKVMAEVVIKALDAAAVLNANAASVFSAVAAEYVAPRLLPIDAIVTAIGNAQAAGVPAQIVKAKEALQPGGVDNTAARAVVAMVEFAIANPLDKPGTMNAGVTLAGGAPVRDPYCRAVLAAARKVREDANVVAARDVANAALNALTPPPQIAWSLMFSGDACYHCVPDMATTQWDVLLAYHHGTYHQFVKSPPGDPPTPVLPEQSWVVYSSGKRNDNGEKVYDHPVDEAIDKYRRFGWTREYYTTHGYGTPGNPNAQHNDNRGLRDFSLI